jgi:flagellar motor switch protein FliM
MGDSTDNIGGGILDQSEIDQLLAAAVAETRPPLIRADGKRIGETEEVRVESYDFRNPTFLTEVELRRLRILHEDFIRYLAARLAMFLRMECGLKMARLQTQTYAKFTEGLASPSHICLFKMEPLVGVGLLDVNPRLALTFVDRLLGGRGHSVKAERYLTEIEVSLLEDVLKIILEEWCSQWKEDKELHHAIIGHENNGRFLQTSPRDSVVLALAIEVSFGDCSEQIQIGLPYYTIEPLVKSLQQRRQKDTAPVAAAAKAEWHDVYEHVQLPVRAEWNLPDMPLREIANMRVGDLLEIPLGNIDQTRILLNGIPKFLGTVGLEGQQVAVKLNRKLTAADDVRS